MSGLQKNILFEDGHVIVVYKPAGIATQTARIGQQDMVSEIKNYLADKPENAGKGQPYLGIVHRLDQPVSGILVFAKTPKAASALSRQLSDDRMSKEYYGVVYGCPDRQQETLEDYLYKDGRTNLSLVVREGFPDARKAVLQYKLIKTLMILEEDKEVSLVEIHLITGRHHQIRAQLAHAGIPLLGDSKYGSPASKDISRGIGCKDTALCAFRLSFSHPVSGKKMCFEKQPEGEIFLPFFTNGI